MELKAGSTALVTGGCGFIGSSLVRALLDRGLKVRVLDNLSVGRIESLPQSDRVHVLRGDLLDPAMVDSAVAGSDTVFHYAAQTNVRLALRDTRVDLDQAVIGTHNVLEAMRRHRVQDIVYASSSCIYGAGLPQPVRESAGPLLPASLYGASKLAGEAVISAYCNTFGLRSWLCRYPNVIGPGLTHGVLLDFIDRLRQTPDILSVFGDGYQSKTYLWLDDCIEGTLHACQNTHGDVNVTNITTRGATSVRDIARMVTTGMGLEATQIVYSDEPIGWPGDVALIQLDGALAASTGWNARYDSSETVKKTISVLLKAQPCGLVGKSAR